MADVPVIGPLSRAVRREGDHAAVLRAAANILARHHLRVTGGSAPPAIPSRPSPFVEARDARADPGAPRALRDAADPAGRPRG